MHSWSGGDSSEGKRVKWSKIISSLKWMTAILITWPTIPHVVIFNYEWICFNSINDEINWNETKKKMFTRKPDLNTVIQRMASKMFNKISKWMYRRKPAALNSQFNRWNHFQKYRNAASEWRSGRNSNCVNVSVRRYNHLLVSAKKIIM